MCRDGSNRRLGEWNGEAIWLCVRSGCFLFIVGEVSIHHAILPFVSLAASAVPAAIIKRQVGLSCNFTRSVNMSEEDTSNAQRLYLSST